MYQPISDTWINNTVFSQNARGMEYYRCDDMTIINNTFESASTSAVRNYQGNFSVYEGNIEIGV
jgi:parallel beta-helix repeat protein